MELIPWKYSSIYKNEKYQPIRIFHFNQISIRIQQIPNNIKSFTGNIVWDAAYILSFYLYHHVPLIDKIIVELGSGHGLLGLAAFASGAKNVILTDIPDQIPLTQLNIEENKHLKNNPIINGHIHAQELMWGHPDPLKELKISSCDYIIASEILYLPDLHVKLLQTIRDLCNKSTKIIMAFKDRNLGEAKFFQIARHYFKITEIQLENITPEFVGSRNVLFEMQLI